MSARYFAPNVQVRAAQHFGNKSIAEDQMTGVKCITSSEKNNILILCPEMHGQSALNLLEVRFGASREGIGEVVHIVWIS